MAEPDPKPQIEATTVANGSGPPKDSGAEAVHVNKQGEEIKGVQELKAGKENNGAAEKEKDEGKQGVEETKVGVENEEDDKARNNSGETKEGGEKDDVKETNDMEETKEKKGENGIKEMNGVEETMGGDDKNSVKDTNNEKDTKEVEEKEGEEKIRDGDEKESSALKKHEGGKVDKDKGVEDQEEGKGEKGNEDVEMAEAENVKEEFKMATDERVEDGGGKSEEKDDVKDKEYGVDTEKEGDVNKKVKGLKKKRSRSRRKVDEREEAKEKEEETKKAGEAKEKKEETKKAGEAKEKKEGMKKPKEPLTSPRPSSIDRPVRERKTVERLVEVIQKETNKGVVVEKGRGTPLKHIPIVAHKLARKKPGDLKLLHQALFGRKGKAVDFKNHILQFSGFAWHESGEKQRAKVKERLDKYVKDALLDLCDLLDISVSKANTKKEDIIVKLLDFVAAPIATTDTLFGEKEQDSPKFLKRKRVARGSALKGTEDVVPKKSRKKRMKSEGTLRSSEKAMPDTEDEDEDDEEDNENVAPEEDEEIAHSESDKENESKEASEKDEGEDDEDSGKDKQDKNRSPKKQNSSKKEKVEVEGSSKKTPSIAGAKSPSKTPSSTRSKSDECIDEGEKVFVRKKKQVDLPNKKSTSKPDIKEKSSGMSSVTVAKSPSKTPSSTRSKSDERNEEGEKVFVRKRKQVDLPKSDERNEEGEKVFVRKKKQVDLPMKKSTSKPDIKEKSSGKRGTGGKPKPEGAGKSNPSKEDLRKTICEILKKVDFSTATLTDILKQLATHYKVDLTPRKATIKLMINEELAKLADEAEENEDDGDSEEEHPKAEGKKVEF